MNEKRSMCRVDCFDTKRRRSPLRRLGVDPASPVSPASTELPQTLNSPIGVPSFHSLVIAKSASDNEIENENGIKPSVSVSTNNETNKGKMNPEVAVIPVNSRLTMEIDGNEKAL